MWICWCKDVRQHIRIGKRRDKTTYSPNNSSPTGKNKHQTLAHHKLLFIDPKQARVFLIGQQLDPRLIDSRLESWTLNQDRCWCWNSCRLGAGWIVVPQPLLSDDDCSCLDTRSEMVHAGDGWCEYASERTFGWIYEHGYNVLTEWSSHQAKLWLGKVDDMKNRHLLHKPIEPHFPSLNDGNKQQFRDNIRPPKAQ